MISQKKITFKYNNIIHYDDLDTSLQCEIIFTKVVDQ